MKLLRISNLTMERRKSRWWRYSTINTGNIPNKFTFTGCQD